MCYSCRFQLQNTLAHEGVVEHWHTHTCEALAFTTDSPQYMHASEETGYIKVPHSFASGSTEILEIPVKH